MEDFRVLKHIFILCAIYDVVKIVSAVMSQDVGKVVQSVGDLCYSLGFLVICHKGWVLDRLSFSLFMGCIVLLSVRIAQYFLLHTYSKATMCLALITMCVFTIMLTAKDEKLNWEQET
ncbi:hypothetical protein [Bacillus thuringiensis]|uniref:hypothetical protein n=1 Tax=Bacillus thuringiensis TaxID=1428 RepID=UPI000BFDCC05|nr:hypothetical protein [Bacillus thuringiensis]PGT90013.1 hypothetical protein COD17_09695 [Bacillus thuringiensis]